jgi:hypothetical protein
VLLEIIVIFTVFINLGHLKIVSERFGLDAMDLLSTIKGRVLAAHIHENDGDFTPL